MAIDIKNLTHRATNNQGAGKPATAVNNSSQSGGNSIKSSTHPDRVSLTSSATMLSALEEQINSLPVADINRVAEIRYALATGAHQINAENTADGLLAVERAFAQKS